MSEAQQVLASIAQNLANAGFKVSRDVMLSDGSTADLAASRNRFSWKGLVILSQHVVVRSVESASQHHMAGLLESSFRFGKKANRLPLVRGLQLGYMILPVIVTDTADRSLVESVTKPPRKRWALFELPVVLELANRRVVFFQGTPLWGAFFFSDARDIVSSFTTGFSQT